MGRGRGRDGVFSIRDYSLLGVTCAKIALRIDSVFRYQLNVVIGLGNNSEQHVLHFLKYLRTCTEVSASGQRCKVQTFVCEHFRAEVF